MHTAKVFGGVFPPLRCRRASARSASCFFVALIAAAIAVPLAQGRAQGPGQEPIVETRELPSTNLLASASVPSAPRIAVASKISPPILPKELADLEIALGRIRMVPDRFRIVRKHEQSAADQFERTVQVATAEGRPNLRLNYSDGTEKWSLRIDPISGTEWTREYTVDHVATNIKYSQAPARPIVIEITQPNHHPARLEALTLWHMTEQNSDEFQKFVLPSLKRLNGAWDLPAALAAARRMRTKCTDLQSDPCGQMLQRCVKELESTDHAVRSAAMEELRSVGLAAHIPLERMTHETLTAQQRSTIHQLLSELEPRSADTPTRLAYWLSGDPSWR